MTTTREFIKQTRTKSQLFFEVISACQKLLYSPNAVDHKKYLNSRVNSKYNQTKYQFGYFPTNDNLQELYLFVDKKKLEELGLVWTINLHDQNNTSFDQSAFNNHNLIWPIKDDYDNIVALLGRSILPEDKLKELKIQKYKYSSFTKQAVLFGLNTAKKAIKSYESAIVVEGQLDAISCHSNGFHNVVALGGSSLSYYQLFLIKKHGAKKLLLLLDNDDPGQKAQDKIIKRYSSYIDIVKLQLPTGYKDVDEYIKGNDASLLLG